MSEIVSNALTNLFALVTKDPVKQFAKKLKEWFCSFLYTFLSRSRIVIAENFTIVNSKILHDMNIVPHKLAMKSIFGNSVSQSSVRSPVVENWVMESMISL